MGVPVSILKVGMSAQSVSTMTGVMVGIRQDLTAPVRFIIPIFKKIKRKKC
jgi:hypothetical protein